MPSDAPPPGVAAPNADDLQRIGADAWAWLLPHLRAALLAVDEEQLPAVRRLRATPPARLAGGRIRREVEALLARGGPLWAELHQRLAAADDHPQELAWLMTGHRAVVVKEVPTEAPSKRDRDREEQLRRRAQRLQDERDEARRQVDGAEARARQAEAERDELRVELERVAGEVEELTRRLGAAQSDREQAVDRERRRGAAELGQLREELASLRRAEQERRQAEERRRQATSVGASAGGTEARTPAPERAGGRSGVRPGRPSELPPRVRPDTREAVEALLGRDRLVLIDGYNLTLSQRGELSLDQQRAWLVQALATQVARRGIRPTVVFDSDVAGPGGRREKGRGVTVRFTAEGTTADDELVFAVAALEEVEPVLVVTDDRELRDRLRPYRVDVVGTAAFSWVLG